MTGSKANRPWGFYGILFLPRWTAEVGAARTMLERTAERFGLNPGRLAGDSAYGSAEMLHWLVDEQKIEPHVPVIDKSER